MLRGHCINVIQRLGALKIQGSFWQNPARLHGGFLEATPRIWGTDASCLSLQSFCGSAFLASLQLVTAMCLSTSITFTDAFTHFPQNTALQPDAPTARAANPPLPSPQPLSSLVHSHPRQGEAENLAESPAATGRGTSCCSLMECYANVLTPA